MKKSVLVLFITFSMLGFQSCGTSSAMSTSGKKYESTNVANIKIFISKLPEKKYEEIGRVSTNRYSFGMKRSGEKMYKSLKEKASKIGGDAIINISEDFASISGVVVKFKE